MIIWLRCKLHMRNSYSTQLSDPMPKLQNKAIVRSHTERLHYKLISLIYAQLKDTVITWDLFSYAYAGRSMYVQCFGGMRCEDHQSCGVCMQIDSPTRPWTPNPELASQRCFLCYEKHVFLHTRMHSVKLA